MENSFFVFTNNNTSVDIERFHICTWEFNNNSSLIEFGFEICEGSIKANQLSISLFIPWFTTGCEIQDLYSKLSIAENCRFIFNDYIVGTDSLDGGRNKLGVIHKFSGRNELCVLPITFEKKVNEVITISVNLQSYQERQSGTKPNIYFRFFIRPVIPFISMRKNGLSKSTIIYDIKVNEKRNIPDSKLDFFSNKIFCNIEKCFSLNIIPNKYDIVFFENQALKNVRTLEFDSFNRYLGDNRVKKDELLVVFNKKENAESFSFFSIYTHERIGTGQFAVAILINIVCGILLFIPSYRKAFSPELELSKVWGHLPLEIYLALLIVLATIFYFAWPSITNKFKNHFRK